MMDRDLGAFDSRVKLSVGKCGATRLHSPISTQSSPSALTRSTHTVSILNKDQLWPARIH